MIARGIPRSYISHTFLHVLRGFCTGGCQEWDEDDMLGLRVEWGLSKLRCIPSDEERQMLTERTKKGMLHKTGKDHCFLVPALTGLGNGLETKTMFLCDFCTASLICHSAYSCLLSWKQMMLHTCSEGMCVCNNCTMCSQVFLISQQWSNPLETLIWSRLSIVSFLYSRGSDGDLVERSENVASLSDIKMCWYIKKILYCLLITFNPNDPMVGQF